MSSLHLGPVMDAVDGFARHCETTLPNSTCPYLALGCLGCTRRTPFHLPLGTWERALQLAPISGAQIAELRKAVEVALDQVERLRSAH